MSLKKESNKRVRNRVQKTGQKTGPKNGWSKKRVKKSVKKTGPKNGSKKQVKKMVKKLVQKAYLLLVFPSYFLGSSLFHSNNGPKSLPAGQQIPESNGPMSLHNNNTNWNPFEDMKNTSSVISAKFFISSKGFQLVLLLC